MKLLEMGAATMKQPVILGSAVTGAKFTPNNHVKTGDDVIDTVSSGDTIKSALADLEGEQQDLYREGCCYYHYHARNPKTHEQSTSNDIYQDVSLRAQLSAPGALISFGASRNGSEVRQAIQEQGEWERISQAAIPLHLGGAHFVTKQAAVELQILLDMKRQGFEVSMQTVSDPGFPRILERYTASTSIVNAKLDTYSSTKGSQYGSTSAFVQFNTYERAVQARRDLQLLHEVEWVQLERSYLLTRVATEHPAIRLGSEGQLNVTLLFGFSPSFPFPTSYGEFREAVSLAKSLEQDCSGQTVRKVTISVGAAVIPQHADKHFIPVDVGPRSGQKQGALERLATYAAQLDSGVDVLRSGMEDTPYLVRPDGRLALSNNVELVRQCHRILDECEKEVMTDPGLVRDRLGVTSAMDAAAQNESERSVRLERDYADESDSRLQAQL